MFSSTSRVQLSSSQKRLLMSFISTKSLTFHSLPRHEIQWILSLLIVIQKFQKPIGYSINKKIRYKQTVYMLLSRVLMCMQKSSQLIYFDVRCKWKKRACMCVILRAHLVYQLRPHSDGSLRKVQSRKYVFLRASQRYFSNLKIFLETFVTMKANFVLKPC